MKTKFWAIMMACICVMLTACSSNEEPTPAREYKFPPLEEICGNTPWMTRSFAYFMSDGSSIDMSEIKLAGLPLGLIFYLNEGTFNEAVDNGIMLFLEKSNYSFDRTTGYLYLNASVKPYAQIIDFDTEAQTITLNARYDYLPMTQIDADCDEPNKVIEGSYAVIEMHPVTNPLLLNAIDNPDEILDKTK